MAHDHGIEIDTYYIEQFVRLADFCHERLGWDVELSRAKTAINKMDEESRTITINENLRPELRLYTLLHEIGHVELWHEADFQLRFPYSESFVDSDSKEGQRKRARVCVLEEECAAWDRAICIALRLGIMIDRETFERDKLRSLLSYIRNID